MYFMVMSTYTKELQGFDYSFHFKFLVLFLFQMLRF